MGKSKKNKIAFYLLSGLLTITAFQNCGYAGPSEPERFMSSQAAYSDLPSYTELSKNVFQGKCMSCHTSGAINFSSYDTLIAGGSVVPGNPAASKLYTQIASGLMPKNGTPLSAADVSAISEWITAGALSGSAPSPAPDAPISLSNMSLSATNVLIAWTMPSQVVTSTQIQRSDSLVGPFTVVADLPNAASSFSDSSLAPATTYYYRVSVSNLTGASPFSQVLTVTTPGYAPSAPTSLVASVISSSQINLTWVDNSADETSFILERANAAAGPFASVATLAPNTVTYSNTALTAATTFYYRVRAANTGGNSTDSNVASAVTQAAVTAAPSIPTGLVATSASSNQINLTWTDTSSTENGFRIERSASAVGPFTLIFSTAANINSYSDTGLTASTAYYYRIASFNGIGNSVYTAIVNATTQAAAVTAPAAPTTLAAVSASTSQINLSWVDASTNESGFKIERASNAAGPFALVFTSPAAATTYSDTGLTSATNYFYRVYSFNSAGNSAFTSIVNATTQAGVPVAPTTLAAAATSSSQINLTWADLSSNETGFKVEQAASVSGPFTLIATLPANTTSYSNTGLSPVVTYYYRVYAYNVGGNSGYTTTGSATTFGTFAWINTNVIAGKCLSCHGSNPKGGYNMSTYAGVKTRVVVSNAAGSVFYQRVLNGSMPEGSAKLTTIQLNAIKTWIDSGAVNN